MALLAILLKHSIARHLNYVTFQRPNSTALSNSWRT